MKKVIHITYKKKKVSKMSTTIRCIRTGIYVLQEVNKHQAVQHTSFSQSYKNEYSGFILTNQVICLDPMPL